MVDEDETVADLVAIARNLEACSATPRRMPPASSSATGRCRTWHRFIAIRARICRLPIQYEVERGGGAGEVRLPRPQDADDGSDAVNMINLDGGSFRIEDIPIDDKPTYDLYTRGDTFGVFQVEGAGMRRALVDMKPRPLRRHHRYRGLYRPGPMDKYSAVLRPQAWARGRGVPASRPLQGAGRDLWRHRLPGTVMQIAQLLSGYSLGEADMLRRAMGKKIKAEMDAQRERFRKGCIEYGLKQGQADTIFDLLAKFANYGFNKSHAATYALVSYQTAFLKAHYPHEFLAASMTLDMGNTDKLAEFRGEAKRHRIELVPPCINRSEVVFSVKDKRILYGLCAVKGVGRQVAEHIVEARGNTPFKDLGDFARRVDPRILSKRTLETLANAGAFDDIVPSREQAFAAIEAVMGMAQSLTAERNEGQWNMFDMGEPEPIRIPAGVEAWSTTERADRELSAIGFHLSAHPLDAYSDLFDKLRVQRWGDFERAVKDGASAGRLAGTISGRQDRRTRKGTPMMILTLSDQTGSYEVIAFSEQINEFGAMLQPGKSVILQVGADERAEGISLRLLSAQPIDGIEDKIDRRLTVFAADAKALGSISAQLKRGGEGSVNFIVIRDGGAREYEIELPGTYRLTAEVAGGIKALEGVTDVRFH
jgi:DNA polymerase-3 subunit alpha